jgi:hypothetical protein
MKANKYKDAQEGVDITGTKHNLFRMRAGVINADSVRDWGGSLLT